MKKIFALLAAAVLVFAAEAKAQEIRIASMECAEDSSSEDEYTLINVGDQVPDFTLTMLDGSTVKMSDLRGKIVLVNFWATWCPPCRAELKRIPEEIVARFADDDFVLLAISRGEMERTVSAFMEENGYKFNPGLDGDQSVYGLFATNYIPRNYLVGKDGKVVMMSLGYIPKEFSEMVELIGELVK